MSDLPGPIRRRFLSALAAPDIPSIDPASALVVLPLGAVEQHGPHLPLFTDCLTVENVLARAVERAGERFNVWTLPLMPFSKSNEHIHFPGTITLSAETLARVLKETAASLARAGFRKLLILNGHGGNAAILEATARDIRVETGLMVFVSMCGFRSGIPAGHMDPHEEKWGLHAGEMETSVVLAVAPELVHTEKMAGDSPRFVDEFKLVGPTRGIVTVAWLSEDLAANGVIGNPAKSSAETGRMAIEGAVEMLCAAFEEIKRFEYPSATPAKELAKVAGRAPEAAGCRPGA
jgi:creatinine amidohydrolase/Fe(II)-dependent formamide hydrolase-like protein